jgi:hypothetical protein
MSKTNRGGLSLKTGKIGRVNCLRQQLLMPGEKMDIQISGKVRMTELRERDVLRINAHLATFYTPMRWLVDNWTTYVTEGPETAETIPEVTEAKASTYGVGAQYDVPTAGPNSEIYQFWKNAYLRCYNEWYKWPEDTDVTSVDDDGEIAVPLSKAWTRARYNAKPTDTENYNTPSTTEVDVRWLAEAQARFRSAMKRDVLSFGRWMELVEQTWKGDGSREVDQVPMMLDQVEVGVNPRELPATDGPSFGQWQSLYDFNVNHSIRGFVAPEHGIITTMLVVRFAPVIEGKHPFLNSNNMTWETLVGDPEFLASAYPVQVKTEDVAMNTTVNQSLGYLPAGWHWRSDHDVIGPKIDALDSFPMMETPMLSTQGKDATRIKNAFQTDKLGDYLADIYFTETSTQPIGTAMDSYFSGMVDHTFNQGSPNQEFPHGGKNL